MGGAGIRVLGGGGEGIVGGGRVVRREGWRWGRGGWGFGGLGGSRDRLEEGRMERGVGWGRDRGVDSADMLGRWVGIGGRCVGK